MNTRQLDDDIAGCAAAHQLLLLTLDDLDDDQARSPSLLPGWTIGHVVTHLARNADSFVRVIECAGRGESAAQYPGGQAQREGDIEGGAGRPANVLVADVRRSIWQLEAAWAQAPALAWEGTVGGIKDPQYPVLDVPSRRWRETEIHHADVGLGFSWEDWSPAFVRRELARQTNVWASRRPMGLTTLPPEALAVAPHRRLAWLVGRAEIDGLAPAGIF